MIKMLWENRQSNYDKYPKIKIKEIDELSSKAYEGYADILTYSPCLNAGDSWIQTILAY